MSFSFEGGGRLNATLRWVFFCLFAVFEGDRKDDVNFAIEAMGFLNGDEVGFRLVERRREDLIGGELSSSLDPTTAAEPEISLSFFF